MQNGKKSKLGSILLGIGAVCVVLRTAPLGGTVRLRTRTGLGKAVRLAGRKTGNAEFDQTFVIASDSDEEMQRVLSASMCERLLAVQQCIGKGWICLLSDGRVSVVADTGSGLFDGTGSGAEALRKEYTGALMQARRVMDALQLPGAQYYMESVQGRTVCPPLHELYEKLYRSAVLHGFYKTPLLDLTLCLYDAD